MIPCSFTPLGDNFDRSSLKGLWYRLKKGKLEVVYDEDKLRVEENFRDRTQLLGNLGQNNCTLEMLEIAEYDDSSFCFTTDSLTQEKNCVKLNIICTSQLPTSVISDTFLLLIFNSGLLSLLFKSIVDPRKPLMSILTEAVEHQPYTLTCSISHTCPSNAPQLTWNREKAQEVHKPCVQGECEVVSILTIIPKEEDDRTNIVCTAKFNSGLTSSVSHKLYVKRETGPDLEEPLCFFPAL